MQNHSDSDKRSEGDDGQSDGRKRLIISRNLIGPLSLLVVIVGAVAAYYAYFYVSRDSVRMQFWIGFMFSFLALVVIVVQVVIYAQQAEFMRQQAKTLEEQREVSDRLAGIAQQALKIGERAYVGVHSINEDFKNDRIILMAENTGNVPAESLKVSGQVWVIIPKQSGLAGMKAGFDHANCSFSKSFYNTRLFRGNLKSRIVIDLLKIALTNKTYIPSVTAGLGTLWLIGSIEYGDGFDSGQITQFAFTYQSGEWAGASINDPELKRAKKTDEKPN